MSAGPFIGLTYAEALTREIPPVQTLVDGLIEAGTVGTVAGLPETYKSFLALAVASKVAAGSGTILGREVVTSGPVGYWWQDDSEARELGRIKDYASRHGYGEEPVRWYLNEGLRLPDNIDALRTEVEREGQALVVLDSLYNFLGGVGMKDEEAAAVLARLKAEVCDPTGASVLIVDHTPWPTEANRGQRRAYGSVFKAAAIRWGIYLDREGTDLYVAAGGNNVPGLDRTQVVFDAETLELRPIEETTAPAGNDLAGRIATAISDAEIVPPTTQDVIDAVGARGSLVAAELRRNARFVTAERRAGTNARAICWRLADQFVPGSGPNWDELSPVHTVASSSLDLSTPVGGGSRAELEAHALLERKGELNDGRPVVCSEDFLPWLFARLEAGLLTEGEWHEQDRAHRLVVATRAR